MKCLITILFLTFILLSLHLFAQENVNLLEPYNRFYNSEDRIEDQINNGGYVILSTGNYVCGEFGYDNLLYVIRNDTLFNLDVNTLDETVIGEITGINSGQIITTIGYSFNSGTMFLGTTSIGTSEFYNLNLTTASVTFIGAVGQPGLSALDVDCSGNIYSIDIIDDKLWEINPVNGAGTPVGLLGFDANYSSHLDFDLGLSLLYLVTFNNATSSEQLRTVDLVTGASTLITDLGGIPITVFAIEGECGPGKASNPVPQDSSINISITLSATSWENPPDAITNEIWWGTDPDSLVLVLTGGFYTAYSIADTLQYSQLYFWRVDEIGLNGTSEGEIWKFTTEDNPTNVSDNNPELLKFSLEQNYPNPFNPSTKIKFAVPSVETRHASSLQLVTLKVFDILGNEVATLVNEELPAGEYEIEFDARILPSGIYFYQLIAGEFVQTKKMILLK